MPPLGKMGLASLPEHVLEEMMPAAGMAE